MGAMWPRASQPPPGAANRCGREQGESKNRHGLCQHCSAARTLAAGGSEIRGASGEGRVDSRQRQANDTPIVRPSEQARPNVVAGRAPRRDARRIRAMIAAFSEDNHLSTTTVARRYYRWQAIARQRR